MTTKLSQSARSAGLASLPEWQLAEGRDAICRTLLFRNFNVAWAFMNQVALYAESHQHHPEWLNVYNRVEITLTTHDVDGLSEKDLQLARFIDAVYTQRYQPKPV